MNSSIMIVFTRLIPLLTCRQCFRMSVSTRQMSLISKIARTQPGNNLYDREKHKIVYYFRPIAACASFIRMKYSFPIINFTAIFGYYVINPDLFILSAAVVISLVNLVVVHVLSKYLVNTIGRIYVNKRGDIEEVIVSVIDKSGRRRDYKHSLDSIHILDPYTRIQEMLNIYPLLAKDSNSIYNLYFSRCQVVDSEAVKTLIGEGNLNKIRMLTKNK